MTAFLKLDDFMVKSENLTAKKKGKREYLNNPQTKDLMAKLQAFFELKIEIPRIKHGKKQTLHTLISEEALLLAKFLRNERKEWIPRITSLYGIW